MARQVGIATSAKEEELHFQGLWREWRGGKERLKVVQEFGGKMSKHSLVSTVSGSGGDVRDVQGEGGGAVEGGH